MRNFKTWSLLLLVLLVNNLTFGQKIEASETITTFPWSEGFEGETFPPANWENTNWKRLISSTFDPGNVFDGKYSAYSSYKNTNATLVTPTMELPANQEIVFYWRDKGDVTKVSTKDTTFFEISTDGGVEWITVSHISMNEAFMDYFFKKHDLSAYAGNNVKMRWRYKGDGTDSSEGTYIDAISIREKTNKPVLELTHNIYDFGLSATGATKSWNVNLRNTGEGDLVVSGITVAAPFSCSYEGGTIASAKKVELTINYNPTAAGDSNENLTINVTGDFAGNNQIALTGESYRATYTKQDFETALQLENWVISSTQGNAFEQVSLAGIDKSRAAKLQADYVSAGTYQASIGTIITPSLNVIAGDKFYFYAKKEGTTDNKVTVQAKVGAVITDIVTVTLTNEYQLFSADLALYVGKNPQIVIKATTGGDAVDAIYIDDIILPDNSTVNTLTSAVILAPENAATDISVATSLKWNAVNNATGYKVMFGTAADALTEKSDQAEITYAFTEPLAHGTIYYWQIIPYNAETTVPTADCPVWSFTTETLNVNTLPFSENFDASALIPEGWTSDMLISSIIPHGVSDSRGLYKKMSETGTFATTPLVGAIESTTELKFDYRIVNYVDYQNAIAAATIVDGDSIQILASKDAGLTFTKIDKIDHTNHTASTDFKTHTVSLASYVGENVLIKVIAKCAAGKEYYLDLDNFLVKTPATTPVASLNKTEWNAGLVAAGENAVSEKFTLKNTGIGTLTVSEITDLSATEFTTTFNASTVSLAADATYEFTFTYTPTDAGTDKKAVVIKTNGGDITVNLEGTRMADGSITESFEEEFLPAGWDADTTIESGWKKYGFGAYEGSNAARLASKYTIDGYLVSEARLITPDLAITAEDNISFYAKKNNDEVAPILKVQYTTDDGETFTDLQTIELTKENKLYIVSLATISAKANAKIAFYGKTIADYCYISVDYVIMPKLNITKVPAVATNPAPEHESINVFIDTELSWTGDILATKYKVMFGTAADALTEVADQTETTFTPTTALEHSKTYYWQVIPYNTIGDAVNCPVWSFTTMADPTVIAYPYNQGFETAVPPVGWKVEIVTEGTVPTLPQWTQKGEVTSPNITPKEGDYMARFNSYSTKGSARLKSAPFNLTSITDARLNFYMYHEESSETKEDKIQIQVSENGTDWTNLGEPILRYSATKGWVNHIIDLSAYNTKTIYIGFLGVSAWGNHIYIDDVNVAEPSDKDLAISSIAIPEIIKGLTATTIKAKVLNNGTENQTNANVTITIGDWTNTKQATVNGGETVEVTFDAWTPTAAGKYTASVNVVLEGDANPDNNTKAANGFVLKAKKAYAYSMYSDESGVANGAASFDLIAPETITTIAEEGENPTAWGGAWANNSWYAFTYKTEGTNTTPEKFIKINPTTGERTELGDVSVGIAAMTYDWSSNTMYAISNITDKYQLYTVNLTNGELTQVGTDTDKPNTFRALACSTDGTLYTVCGDEKLYKINKTDATITEVGNLESGQVKYIQSMDFDHESGILYWCQSNDSNGNLRVIDTETGKSYLVGQLQANAEISALAIPHPEYNPEPAFTSTAITNATAGVEYTYDIVATDANNDDLTITAPTKPEWITFTAGSENGKATLSGTPTETGDFNVKLVVTDGKTEVTQEFTIKVAVNNATNDFAISTISIYPNPSNGEFNLNIDSKTANNYTVEVINAQGKMVYTSSLKGSNTYNEKINISQLAKGVYMVRIKSDNNVTVKRVIVQ